MHKLKENEGDGDNEVEKLEKNFVPHGFTQQNILETHNFNG